MSQPEPPFDRPAAQSAANAANIGWHVGGPTARALIATWGLRGRHMTLVLRALARPVRALAALIASSVQMPPLVHAALAFAILVWRVPMTNSEGQRL